MAITSVAADPEDVPTELGRLAELLASDSAEEVVLIARGLSLPEQAMADFSAPGPRGTFALTAGSEPGTAVRVAHGRIVAVAADEFPEPGTASRCPGLLHLAANDRKVAADAVTAAAQELRARQPGAADAFTWLLRAVVRAGVVVRAEPIAPWPWGTQDEVVAVTAADAARIRLTRANRSDDGWYSVSVLRRLSKPVTALAARRGWSPNAITVVSLVIGLAAAGLFAVGQFWAMVIGAVLLQLSLVVDCADGEVARLTGRFSRTGAWLDAVTDRVKEFAAYAGLAAGAAGGTDGRSWWLAAALMTLQTVRHLSDYTFTEVQKAHDTADVAGPLLSGAAASTSRVTPVADPSESSGPAVMLRRTLFLPIGERWLLLSAGAILLGGWWTLILLFGVGVLSLGYATIGRIRRTLRWHRGPIAEWVIADQLDTGLFTTARPWARIPPVAPLIGVTVVWLIALVALLTGWGLGSTVLLLLVVALLLATPSDVAWLPFAWAVPAVIAAIEMSLWLAAGLAAGFAATGFAAPPVFMLLFAIAFHRYDLLYRAIARRPPPLWLQALCGGVPVRLLILVVLLVTGTVGTGILVIGVYLLIVSVILASVQWLGRAG